MEKKNVVLNSMQPITDGGRKYNVIYIILAIIFFIIMICANANFLGIVCGPLFGMAIGWLIKNKILELQSPFLRNYTFQCNEKIQYQELMNRIIPTLTQMNMRVELNSDGGPMITHLGTIYDVFYNKDNTFTIWWRKSIGKALLLEDYIRLYRNVSADMGIIAYTVQKATNEKGYISNEEEVLDSNNINIIGNREKYFCSQCGTEMGESSLYCPRCGNKR
ncbi:MAG: hypothetical protein E7290_01050 [Lachnospiraceae bacterium]|nr:hypothetical protein [Lachnospiraceae bacterium]